MRLGPVTITGNSQASGPITLGLLDRASAGVAVVQKSAVNSSFVTQWSPLGWFSSALESFAGAWQRGVELRVDTSLSHVTAWACMTLIASDIAKLRIKLTQTDQDGIASEVENSAYSPVLRKPNHYQNRIQFLTSWIISKLSRGNAYVLKERDNKGGTRSGNVTALHVLDPSRVRVLVSPNGFVFYALGGDALANITDESVVVPASEIIHDILIPLFHPLCGVSVFYALGHVISQGLKILHNSSKLFQNGSQPSGVLTAPTTISPETAERIQKHWNAEYAGEQNIGKVAVLGDGLHFEPMSMTAVDAQLIDQLKWGDEKVCSAMHVPGYMVGVGPMPALTAFESLNQQYYSQCLQNLIEAIELCLEEGIEVGAKLGIELDLDGLLRMDSTTKMQTTTKGIKGGIFTPNDGRKIFNKKPLPGGDTVYLQEQDHSLEALAKRDAGDDPFGKAAPKVPLSQAVPAKSSEPADGADDESDAAEFWMKSVAVLERADA